MSKFENINYILCGQQEHDKKDVPCVLLCVSLCVYLCYYVRVCICKCLSLRLFSLYLYHCVCMDVHTCECLFVCVSKRGPLLEYMVS